MATSIARLAEELEERTKWQKTPEPLTPEDYDRFIINGIKRCFIDTGRYGLYTPDKFFKENITPLFDYDFGIDEEEYILLVAQIQFFQRVQNDVNNIVGYTTNALTVTNADKPYANLEDTINKLEQERRIVYYKMVRYCIGEA